MDVSALKAIDSWPYRHRLADVMRAPAITVTADDALAEEPARYRGWSVRFRWLTTPG